MSAATALVRSLKAEALKTAGLPGVWVGAALALSSLRVLIEHGERPDLEAGNLAQSIPDAVEGGVHGHAQRRGHVTSVGVPRNRADRLLAGLFQALQVPLERPLLIGRGRRSLRKRKRQIPQAPGHSARGLRVLGLHRPQKVCDRLLPGEHAHSYVLPPLPLPPAPTPGRGHHPQIIATRDQTRNILDPLDIVEHHEPVAQSGGLQVL